MRWTCVDCPANSEVDLCSRCDRSAFRSGVHDPVLHQFVAVTQAEQYYADDDYAATMGEYNYLDPVCGLTMSAVGRMRNTDPRGTHGTTCRTTTRHNGTALVPLLYMNRPPVHTSHISFYRNTDKGPAASGPRAWPLYGRHGPNRRSSAPRRASSPGQGDGPHRRGLRNVLQECAGVHDCGVDDAR